MQSQPATTADLSELYDEDFFEWTQRNARLLRAGKVRQSDIEHIAQEIADLGKQDLKELHRRSRALLAHLLLWQLRPGKRSSLLAITNQRIALHGLFKQSTSLKGKLASELPDTFAKAVRVAMAKTALKSERFPVACPFTLEQILDLDFLLQVQ
jgi:uncharacterized protein DUF29